MRARKAIDIEIKRRKRVGKKKRGEAGRWKRAGGKDRTRPPHRCQFRTWGRGGSDTGTVPTSGSFGLAGAEKRKREKKEVVRITVLEVFFPFTFFLNSSYLRIT